MIEISIRNPPSPFRTRQLILASPWHTVYLPRLILKTDRTIPKPQSRANNPPNISQTPISHQYRNDRAPVGREFYVQPNAKVLYFPITHIPFVVQVIVRHEPGRSSQVFQPVIRRSPAFVAGILAVLILPRATSLGIVAPLLSITVSVVGKRRRRRSTPSSYLLRS